MSIMDTGTYGAKVQSWASANPRDLLKRIIDDNPGADEKTLLSILNGRLRGEEGEALLDSVVEYWFANNYRSIIHQPRRSPAHTAAAVLERAQLTEVIKEKVKHRIHREANLILMDLVLPNGKQLRDATFADCIAAGGFFSKVGQHGKPNQIVGKVFTEEQLRCLA